MDQLLLPGVAAVAPLNETNIRADYEALLDRCARLTAYARSSPQDVFSSVAIRQDRLAEDDLVIFALRARRFIVATSFEEISRQIIVPTRPLRSRKHVSVWRVINAIVHYTDLNLARSSQIYDVLRKYLAAGWLQLADFIYSYESRTFAPVVLVVSDRERLGFELWAFLQVFIERILRPATISCRERGVDITDLERDLVQVAEIITSLQGDPPDHCS